MKILIANPPWRQGHLFGLRSGARFPYMTDELTWEGVPAWIPFPFTPAQATALLKKHGFQCEFWDGVAEGWSKEEFFERVRRYQPDLYIQEVVAPSYTNDRAIFETLRHMLPQAVLGAAGLMVTGWGPQMLEKNPAIDVGLVYEWEETALELAQRLRDRQPLAHTRGLLHRANGSVVVEPRRPPPDLAALPWPERESLPMLRYNDDFAFLPVPNLQMYTERGCPYKCSFCVWINARYGNYLVRFRDPADVADEMAWCLKRWPFKAVYFDDDTFNLRKSHVLKLCEEIRRRDIRIPWAAMCRADLFDRETLTACREAGLFAVKYGVESADPDILAGIHKDLDLDKAEEVIRLTRELGIKVHLTLVIGLPGETERSIRKTWRFVKRTHPDYLQFSLCTPYPGTELYKLAEERGWIEARDWQEFNADSQASMRTEALSRERLEHWVRVLNLRRIGLQLIHNPLDCLKMYGRKVLASPRKVLNLGRSFLRTLTGS
ncbi:MAG: Radical SAM domain protein [Candidatus Ozemobacter sibiricus]|uniref:Radical SAM domain protein n=1 Tax=Candidatus Ozemobacter sibiricus TaxID=2268124 RepID=A0A367ZT09_9BACT|nr:MAG: Radical SAM domain protein [Candidatus Ozemobacter sibiricus]